jgi:hypothetical protein
MTSKTRAALLDILPRLKQIEARLDRYRPARARAPQANLASFLADVLGAVWVVVVLALLVLWVAR